MFSHFIAVTTCGHTHYLNIVISNSTNIYLLMKLAIHRHRYLWSSHDATQQCHTTMPHNNATQQCHTTMPHPHPPTRYDL